MNLKKDKFLAVFVITALCFLCHFMYDWFKNPVFSIFFPVNESVFEHMKIIYTSILLYGIIDYIILNKCHIDYNNFFSNLFLSSFLPIPIYLMIFYPFYSRFGESMFLNISIMVLVIIISQIISYYVLNFNKNFGVFNILAFIMIIVLYVVFGYFTYFPLKKPFFFDTNEEKYGINIYDI